MVHIQLRSGGEAGAAVSVQHIKIVLAPVDGAQAVLICLLENEFLH